MNYQLAVKMLEQVKTRFHNNQAEFLCLALDIVARGYPPGSEQRQVCEDLQDWIRTLLDNGRYFTLENWLVAKGHVIHELDAMAQEEKRVNTRLAWIDWMIEELKR